MPVFSTKSACNVFVSVAGAAILTACTAQNGGSVSTYAAPTPSLKVCSGYGCIISQRFQPTDAEIADVSAIMAEGNGAADAERKAIAKAISWFETTARKHLRHQPDTRKAWQRNAGKRGQMDCVDESLNTTGYLQFMAARGMLRHHNVRSYYAERGLIVDGRYPHKSAVIIDKAGKSWTVDSWYYDDGVPPQIMPLADWRKVWDSFG